MKYDDYFVNLKIYKWFSAFLLVITASLAQSSYTGPGANTGQGSYTGPGANTNQGQQGATTVAAILQKPWDDMRVVLIGNLVRKVRHETYMFSDGTGEIMVEIDDEAFPAQPVQATTKVEIMGKLDMERAQPEIDVKWMRVVQ